MKKDGLSPDYKVDETNAVSVLNRRLVFGSLLTLESFKFNGWVIHGDLAVVLMVFGLVTFTKVKTTLTILHNEECYPPNCVPLDFCSKGGQFRRQHVVVKC